MKFLARQNSNKIRPLDGHRNSTADESSNSNMEKRLSLFSDTSTPINYKLASEERYKEMEELRVIAKY